MLEGCFSGRDSCKIIIIYIVLVIMLVYNTCNNISPIMISTYYIYIYIYMYLIFVVILVVLIVVIRDRERW